MGESSRNYQNGKIYCIKNYITPDIYVGSTTQALSKRMEKHRASMNCEKRGNGRLYQKMRELGMENFYISLLEKYACNDIEELRAKEGEWITKVGNLNVRIAGRTPEQYRRDTLENKKEYDKEYHKNNKEKRSEQAKDRYEEKKDYIKQKSSDNYYKNKEAIREKRNAKCHCECGITYSYGNRLRHF